MKQSGFVIPEVVWVVVVAGGALMVAVPNFRLSHLFAKDPVKSADADLVKAQADLANAQADAKAATDALEAAKKAERDRQTAQVAYSQQMAEGAHEALRSATPEPPVKLAQSFLERTGNGLSAAIGALPPEKQAEVAKIVADALSGVQARLDDANAKLAAKDKELAITTTERDGLRAQIPQLQSQLTVANSAVVAKSAEVATKTQAVVAVAQKLQSEIKESGSLGAQMDNLIRLIAIGALVYLLVHVAMPSLAQEFPQVRLLQGANRTLTSLFSSHEIVDQAKPPLT